MEPYVKDINVLLFLWNPWVNLLKESYILWGVDGLTVVEAMWNLSEKHSTQFFCGCSAKDNTVKQSILDSCETYVELIEN